MASPKPTGSVVVSVRLPAHVADGLAKQVDKEGKPTGTLARELIEEAEDDLAIRAVQLDIQTADAVVVAQRRGDRVAYGGDSVSIENHPCRFRGRSGPEKLLPMQNDATCG